MQHHDELLVLLSAWSLELQAVPKLGRLGHTYLIMHAHEPLCGRQDFITWVQGGGLKESPPSPGRRHLNSQISRKLSHHPSFNMYKATQVAGNAAMQPEDVGWPQLGRGPFMYSGMSQAQGLSAPSSHPQQQLDVLKCTPMAQGSGVSASQQRALTSPGGAQKTSLDITVVRSSTDHPPQAEPPQQSAGVGQNVYPLPQQPTLDEVHPFTAAQHLEPVTSAAPAEQGKGSAVRWHDVDTLPERHDISHDGVLQAAGINQDPRVLKWVTSQGALPPSLLYHDSDPIQTLLEVHTGGFNNNVMDMPYDPLKHGAVLMQHNYQEGEEEEEEEARSSNGSRSRKANGMENTPSASDMDEAPGVVQGQNAKVNTDFRRGKRFKKLARILGSTAVQQSMQRFL
ncbi:hypothetical protein QJQ45_013822 [Haematococcus lacustris]|nr:hypothetical protein QJQ45_013822 [Haematococcus lacustris]